MSRRARDLAAGLVWVSPWLIGFAAFMALPIILSLYYSLCDYTLLQPPIYIGLDNYRDLLHDTVFAIALRNTGLYALFAIPTGTLFALLVAVLLNQRLPGVTIARSVVFLPTLVPIVASAIIWLWLFNGEYGLINRILAVVGIHGPAWLDDRDWAMPALIIMSYWTVGQAVVIYLAALQDVPRTLEEAAAIDGMGAARRLYHVVLPMISPVILFNIVISTIAALQVFIVPFVMTKGGPDRATYFYTHYLYDQGFIYGNMGYASALAWIQLLIVLALTGVVFTLGRRFVYYRAGP